MAARGMWRPVPTALLALAVLVTGLVAVAAVAAPPLGTASPRAAAAVTEPSPGGTLHVAMPQPAYAGFDPEAAYMFDQFEVLRCCLQRTLMTFRGLPGFEGFRAVPDLAEGPPTVSVDGRTWTFHLRSGIHYSPPLEDVEVTAADFVRALERSAAANGPGLGYLKPLLEGYEAFVAGRSDSIAGAVAVDDHTLQLRETRPDRSIVDLMAMAFSAPIPPSPSDPTAPLGVATGHTLQLDQEHPERPLNDGYGPFQVSTGPYMIEGIDQVDFTLAPDQQQPAAGFTPAWWFDPPSPGRLVLVRNPSWDSATDPNRPAYPDRIEITIEPRQNPYEGLRDGSVDTVIGEDPSLEELARYRTPEERARVYRSESNGTSWVTFNLAQPPFDDVHVRRAYALALDRQGLQESLAETGVQFGPVTSHLVPNALSDNLLAGWQPDLVDSSASRQQLALAEMRKSRYWRDGHCVAAACRPVIIGGAPMDELTDAMEVIGLRSRFVVTDFRFERKDCSRPTSHMVACFFGWIADYPGTGSLFQPFLTDTSGRGGALAVTAMGATPGALRRAGMSVTHVPSVQSDYDRCIAALPAQAPTCWAHLDQWLTSKLVAIVPVVSRQTVRLAGTNVTAFSIDQANTEPSLDRIAVTSSG